MKLSPTAFERMVLDLMARMGYGTFENAATMTPATGDEGIDGIIMQDKLGFDLIYVQAKRWDPDHLVGRPDVQAFVGAISGRAARACSSPPRASPGRRKNTPAPSMWCSWTAATDPLHDRVQLWRGHPGHAQR